MKTLLVLVALGSILGGCMVQAGGPDDEDVMATDEQALTEGPDGPVDTARTPRGAPQPFAGENPVDRVGGDRLADWKKFDRGYNTRWISDVALNRKLGNPCPRGGELEQRRGAAP